MIGQQCLDPGSAKMTYGTGGFLLVNVGDQVKLDSYTFAMETNNVQT